MHNALFLCADMQVQAEEPVAVSGPVMRATARDEAPQPVQEQEEQENVKEKEAGTEPSSVTEQAPDTRAVPAPKHKPAERKGIEESNGGPGGVLVVAGTDTSLGHTEKGFALTPALLVRKSSLKWTPQPLVRAAAAAYLSLCDLLH